MIGPDSVVTLPARAVVRRLAGNLTEIDHLRGLLHQVLGSPQYRTDPQTVVVRLPAPLVVGIREALDR